jgi:SAM-dependent methyltransferase
MCNQACIDFVLRVLPPDAVAGRRILEVGSYDTTGTVRPGLEACAPLSYVGVDIVPGPSVDELCNVLDLARRFGPGAFDIVISTEMVEHVRDWRRAFRNMFGVLAEGGTLVVTTRSFGFAWHSGPEDYWRYEPADMAMIAAGMAVQAIERDPISPGVFVAARRTSAPIADLDSVALYSMIKRRRVLNITDGDVRRFDWTTPHRLGRRVPGSIRRKVKQIWIAAGRSPT